MTNLEIHLRNGSDCIKLIQERGFMKMNVKTLAKGDGGAILAAETEIMLHSEDLRIMGKTFRLAAEYLEAKS